MNNLTQYLLNPFVLRSMEGANQTIWSVDEDSRDIGQSISRQ